MAKKKTQPTTPQTIEAPMELEDKLFSQEKRHKILMLCDHPLHPSGVGTQAQLLINGLIKTGKFKFQVLGGAHRHEDYRNVSINENFVIKPVNGFGDKNLVRHLLISEQPDAILIFTDPRQFVWLWEMHDEIHQICPIAYWHVWDNDPYPDCNSVWYESTDLINCISKLTYDLVSPKFPEKTNYVPHAFPKEMYQPLDKEVIKQNLAQHFVTQTDPTGQTAFKALWVNRNAHRKMPTDMLLGWKRFLELLQEKHGHQNAVMLMRTEPMDIEGPNLFANIQLLGLQDKVLIQEEKLRPQEMMLIHNMCDVLVNVSRAEGFGLSTLINLQCGKPIIALKTGGETSKVIDSETGDEMGVALTPVKRALIGSQQVPYIYEDYFSTEDLANAFMKIYEMTDEEKDAFKAKATAFVDREFVFEKMISDWETSLEKCILDFKNRKQETGHGVASTWTCVPLTSLREDNETTSQKPTSNIEELSIELTQ